jgi:hypothetical protein
VNRRGVIAYTLSGRRVRNYSASVHAREAARSYILMDMDGTVVVGQLPHP